MTALNYKHQVLFLTFKLLTQAIDAMYCAAETRQSPKPRALSREFRMFKKKTIYMIGIVVTTIGS